MAKKPGLRVAAIAAGGILGSAAAAVGLGTVLWHRATARTPQAPSH